WSPTPRHGERRGVNLEVWRILVLSPSWGKTIRTGIRLRCTARQGACPDDGKGVGGKSLQLLA
ncbi:MAG: hypothetical protein PUH68_07540, partial [Bacteroidales bacterium]|nr:hypothetical protein [Bacteroidales bacterium]